MFGRDREWTPNRENPDARKFLSVAGKIIAVTGASSGIGRATALLLAEKGAFVILGARREDALKGVAEEIVRNRGRASYIPTDVRNRHDLEALVGVAVRDGGQVDVIINCAGIGPISRFDALDVEGWDAMIDVNLRGTLYGIAAALPVFRRQNSGHVVNVISTAGIRLVPGMGVYAATKNAVRTATEVLRQEAGPNLRLTEVSPGMIATEHRRHHRPCDPGGDGEPDERRCDPAGRHRARHPLRDRTTARGRCWHHRHSPHCAGMKLR